MGKDAIVEWDQKPVPMIPGDYYQGKGHPVSGGKVSIWEILVSLLTI